MLLQFLLLAAGLALVVKGGDMFVRASVWIAAGLKIPRVVVGGTLMSLATTTPEGVVSAISGLKGESGLALGNATGSVVCNFALIGGMLAVLGSLRMRRETVKTPLIILLSVSALATLFSLDGLIDGGESLVLVLAGAFGFGGDLVRHLRTREDPLPEISPEDAESLSPPPASMAKCAGLFIFAAAIVIVGSRLLVDSAVAIAQGLGVPASVVGVTIVAIGTSLPELVSAITSARQGVSDLAVGNIIGANIANLTLVLGSAGILSPIPLPGTVVAMNLPPMLGIVGLFAWLALANGEISRGWGRVLLALYAGYLVFVVLLAMKGT